MKLKERMREAMNRYKKVKGIDDPVLEDYCSQSYNNLVAKVSFGGKYYAVKSYKLPHKNDIRNRYQAEVNFLDYCSKFTDATNIPVLEAKYDDISCSILSWIDGVKIKKFEISNIIEIAEFIEQINENSSHIKRFNLGNASEYCELSTTVSENTLNEIKRLMSYTSESKVIELMDKLQNKAQTEYNKLSDLKDKSWWKEKEFIVSPSDIGIQNCLSSSNNLVFIDFEYAGLDDMAKLINDLVHQPNHEFNEIEENIIINEIQKRNICSDSWKQRYDDLREIIKIRWEIIKIKKAIKNQA